ncbi:MAG: D-alanyl-D-alanine carboxypeptidase [Clostridia bacterium]|nr:D-alanyl-D-alanine carboxypeptidase [Clostridia bacterium]
MPDFTQEGETLEPQPFEGEQPAPNTVETASKTPQRNLMTGEVLIERTSKRVLYGSNENALLYPASTTKVLTALCVLNNLPLGRVVEIPSIAVGVEGSSIYLRAGQKISVEDLLYGMMLRSGNDAAVALAVETCGNIEDFAKLMNDTAKQCGAKNSNFVNPHGLHDENHYTTALDLALITAKAYENPDFVRIVSSKTRKIKVDDVETVIANKNKMLKNYEGANGVKTGFTKASGRCLVSGAIRSDMQLVSVVLNCGDMWNESVRLLNFGFDNYEMVALDNALLTGGDNVIKISVPQNIGEDWKDVKFPMKKDGSERLVVCATKSRLHIFDD